jgi:Predicted spermidine synthase with an N-terminal membrane domain
MTRHSRLLALATTISGAAALMHETLWTRFLANILGSTVQAAAAMFAAFLVGLALGAWLFGRVVDRLSRTTTAYAVLEVVIAVSAVTVGGLLHRGRMDLPALLGQSTGAFGMMRAFLVAVTFVIVPTLAMGATFPTVLAAYRRLGADAVGLTRLYALNTVGAALGTLLCGWYLMPSFGMTSSILIAGSFNLVCALLCIPRVMAERRGAPYRLEPEPRQAQVASQSGERRTWLYLVAVTSGAGVLALEVVWSRIASFTLGNRTFAFSTLLAWVLMLLSVGAWLSGSLVRRAAGRIPSLIAALLLMSTVGIIVSVVLVDAWILDPRDLGTTFKNSPGTAVVVRTLGMGGLMALFLVPLGCLFPSGLACLPHIEVKTGSQAGRYYLWNTFGSVAGSLLTGFLVIPSVGSFASAAMVALICAIAALTVFASRARKGSRKAGALAGLCVSMALIAAVPLLMPSQLRWSHPGDKPFLRVEDEWGVFQLAHTPEGYIRATSNRTELVFLLGSFPTTYVQEMQGHIGSFLRPHSRIALVLGSGYGLTAAALAENPRLERIDAVEILPAMIEAAGKFEPYNHSYQRNPRIRVLADDGRHFLARAKEKYDIISINVTDAHLPGASSLFNSDFYQVVKAHLHPDAVVIQHVFGKDAKIVLSTLSHSFQHLRAFPAYQNGYNVAVSDAPLEPDRTEVETLAAQPTMQAALVALGIVAPVEPWRVFAKGLRPSDLSTLIDPTLVSTDDRPLLEFSRTGDAPSWFFSND